jgi:hypothetical protein
MANRVFFPQELVDTLLLSEKVDLRGSELHVLGEGRVYAIHEAVLVTVDLTGTDDLQLVGRVKAKATLVELGAEIYEGSMILGDSAFDVVPGWMGIPKGSFATHLSSEARANARRVQPGFPDCDSDEGILAALAEC